MIPFSRIWFGDIAYPNPSATPHVLIDYVRWHEGAVAPVPEPGAAMVMGVGFAAMAMRRRRRAAAA